MTDAEVVTLTTFETDRLRVSEYVPTDVELGLGVTDTFTESDNDRLRDALWTCAVDKVGSCVRLVVTDIA